MSYLFNLVCAVSSRYYVSRPEIYPLAMDFARDAAGKGLVEGKQSVDMCQAYLIMAVYPVPKKKWVEDRSWLLMGVAIRYVAVRFHPRLKSLMGYLGWPWSCNSISLLRRA